MIRSMTGFGSREAEVISCGKISVELRSSNHKFLETVFHLPEGFLSLEDKIKRALEAKIKRGRVTCVITIVGAGRSSVLINKPLLQDYITTLGKIKKQFKINDQININTLIHLPGVLSLEQHLIPKTNIWPRLKVLVGQALDDLLGMRRKEGAAMYGFLKQWADALDENVYTIKSRFKKAIKEKLKNLNTDEERANFLKESDITEELQRLGFHIKNFKHKLLKNGPIGKELDFIAQEMQREANTLGAKTFDAAISAKTVQVKSQIEKIREQVQNIE